MLKSFILGASAFTMIAAPVVASAAPVAHSNAAQSLSSSTRAGTPTNGKSRLAGGSIAAAVIGVGVLAGVAYLIIDKENDDDNDRPASR